MVCHLLRLQIPCDSLDFPNVRLSSISFSSYQKGTLMVPPRNSRKKKPALKKIKKKSCQAAFTLWWWFRPERSWSTLFVVSVIVRNVCFYIACWVASETQMCTDVDSVLFAHRDIKGHNLAANVRLFVHRKLDGNLAERVSCEHRKPFHFPQFAPLFFTLMSQNPK
jgi:hypothetical protein